MTIESVVKMVKAAVPKELAGADEEALQREQERLKELPYFSGNDIRDALDYEGQTEGLLLVSIVLGLTSTWPGDMRNLKRRKNKVLDRILPI